MVDNTITISVEKLECLSKISLIFKEIVLMLSLTSFNSASEALAMIELAI